MWCFASNPVPETVKDDKPSRAPSSECSDDDISMSTSRLEGLECLICWESFNIVENVPYVLWCGHTLCKNCVLGLQGAVLKFPTLPIQLPYFISCPWCNMLSFRLVHKGNLKSPRKNFFLLWMVENMNGNSMKHRSLLYGDHQQTNKSLTSGNQACVVNQSHASCSHPTVQRGSNRNEGRLVGSYFSAERLYFSLHSFFVFLAHLSAKFPLVVIFLLIVLYAIPACVAILALYILITILFGVPSFLVLYFACPSLDWLVREIIGN